MFALINFSEISSAQKVLFVTFVSREYIISDSILSFFKLQIFWKSPGFMLSEIKRSVPRCVSVVFLLLMLLGLWFFFLWFFFFLFFLLQSCFQIIIGWDINGWCHGFALSLVMFRLRLRLRLRLWLLFLLLRFRRGKRFVHFSWFVNYYWWINIYST